jgi:hypothetical protein
MLQEREDAVAAINEERRPRAMAFWSASLSDMCAKMLPIRNRTMMMTGPIAPLMAQSPNASRERRCSGSDQRRAPPTRDGLLEMVPPERIQRQNVADQE